MAISTAAALIGSAVIGGVASSRAAGKQGRAAGDAARRQAESADKATDLQREMWELQAENQKPWQTAGVNALSRLTRGTAEGGSMIRPFGMSDYQADPGYAFRLNQGMKSLESTAAARGGLLSGNAMRGAVEFGQDMGSQEYQNAYERYQTNQGNEYNRLASMAGLGQTANTNIGAAGQNYANRAGDNYMTTGVNAGNALLAAGNARASAYQGWGNALGQGLSGIRWNPRNTGYAPFGGGSSTFGEGEY